MPSISQKDEEIRKGPSLTIAAVDLATLRKLSVDMAEWVAFIMRRSPSG